VAALIDLSHVVEAGMTTYPGMPGPIVCDYLSREASREHYDGETTFHIAKIEMIANTGTYVDSPFHRYEHGADLSELDLASLANLEGVVIDARATVDAVDAGLFAGLDVRGKAVLVRTGWDRHWATERYLSGNPFLTGPIAELLRDGGAAIVGIDSLNVDDTRGGGRPVHSTLLGAGIPVAEHLCNLGALPASGFRFHAVPVKFRGVGTFPVRAYAVVS